MLMNIEDESLQTEEYMEFIFKVFKMKKKNL